MKTLMIFLVLLLPTILSGQVINHFDNLDSEWNVAKTYPDGNQQNPNFAATTTTIFTFQGDTVVNGEQWFKLYSATDSSHQDDLLYRGLLREDNSRVLYIDTLDQLDTLYDFNVSVGDSVEFELNGTTPEWLEVINVDSIEINGALYKRIKFEEPTVQAFDKLNEVWIEGIGSIHGPLFPNYPVKFSQEIPDSMLVTCSYADNQQVWQHPSYESCYVDIVLGVEKKEIVDFNLYPNPFSDNIYFDNSSSEGFDLAVRSSTGKLLKQLHIKDDHKTIDLSGLNEGIYFLTFRGRETIKTIKIIKKQ